MSSPLLKVLLDTNVIVFFFLFFFSSNVQYQSDEGEQFQMEPMDSASEEISPNG